MASFIARLWNRMSGRQAPLTIMFIGLDNAGKTNILETLATASQWSQSGGGAGSQSSPTTEAEKRPPIQEKPQKSAKEESLEEDTNDAYGDLNYHSDVFNDFGPILASPAATSTNETPKDKPARPGSRNTREPKDKVNPTIGYNYEVIQFRGLSLNVLDFSGQSRYRALWQEFVNCIDGIVFVIDSSDLIRLVVARDELETILSNPFFSTLESSSLGARSGKASMIPGSTGQQSAAMMAPINMQVQQKQISITSQGKLLLAPLDGAAGGASSSSSSRSGGNGQSTRDQSTIRPASKGSKRRVKVPILLLANKTDLSNAADPEVITRALNLNQLVDKTRHPWLVQATSVYTKQGIFEAFTWLISEMRTA